MSQGYHQPAGRAAVDCHVRYRDRLLVRWHIEGRIRSVAARREDHTVGRVVEGRGEGEDAAMKEEVARSGGHLQDCCGEDGIVGLGGFEDNCSPGEGSRCLRPPAS